MKFARLFLNLTYAVATMGFLALVLSGEVGPVGLAAIAVGLVGSRGGFRRFSPSEQVWKILTVFFLIFAAFQYLGLARPLLSVAQDLLIYLQVNRLFVRRYNRDYAHIFLMAFLQILLGCILTVNPLYALILVGFMISSAWALMMLQLKIGMDEQFAVEESIDPSRTARTSSEELRYQGAVPLLRLPFVLASAGATLLMLVITVLLFLLTPRMEISLFQRHLADTVHVAGFSDEVTLGEVGRILNSRGRVMRVKVDARPGVLPAVPYWRGMALDEFDGRNWRLSRNYEDLYRTRPMLLNRDHVPRGTNVIQHFTLEPLDSRVIFALPDVLEIESSVASLVRNYTNSFQTIEKQGRLDYVVYSKVRDPSLEELRADPGYFPKRLAEIYLQLPTLSPAVTALAERITADASTSYDKARAIESYLRSNYTYTLNPKSKGQAPLEDFLFNTKAGHCEYFASAMVVLARSAGVPARLVNGFMGGELNPVGGYYVVRQNEAHSWVEVWLGRNGFVQFDPTPSGATAGAQRSPDTWQRRLNQYIDYLEMQWYYYVLDYDLRAQLDLFSELLNGTRGMGTSNVFERESPSAGRVAAGMGATLAVVVAAAAIGGVWLLARRGRRGEASPELETPRGRRFLRRRRTLHRELERRGFPRRPGETPLERAGRAGRELGRLDELEAIEAVYYAARYGQVAVRQAQLEQLEEALALVRRTPRRKRAGSSAGNGAGQRPVA